MKFSQTAQPKNKMGRPKGSRNKRSQIPDTLHKEALKQLTQAVKDGEQYAILAILDRTMPKLKPTATGYESDLLIAQTQLTNLKCLEVRELEERITAIEEAQANE